MPHFYYNLFYSKSDSSEDENKDRKEPSRPKDTEPETSYSYQHDVQNDPNVNKPAFESSPPFKDVESQRVYQPVTTQIFNVSLIPSSQVTHVEVYINTVKNLFTVHQLQLRYSMCP